MTDAETIVELRAKVERLSHELDVQKGITSAMEEGAEEWKSEALTAKRALASAQRERDEERSVRVSDVMRANNARDSARRDTARMRGALERCLDPKAGLYQLGVQSGLAVGLGVDMAEDWPGHAKTLADEARAALTPAAGEAPPADYRGALRDLVAAMPRCEGCPDPATKRTRTGILYCDACAKPEHLERTYAVPLRLALALLEGKS